MAAIFLHRWSWSGELGTRPGDRMVDCIESLRVQAVPIPTDHLTQELTGREHGFHPFLIKALDCGLIPPSREQLRTGKAPIRVSFAVPSKIPQSWG